MRLDSSTAEIVLFLRNQGYQVNHPIEAEIGDDPARIAVSGNRYVIVTRKGSDLHAECFDDKRCDPTVTIRNALRAEINVKPGSREALEAEHGQVWDPNQLGKDFDVIGFAAPFVVVQRKSDGQKGSLLFQATPRFYFSFKAHQPTGDD